jgi:hypothetical protein
MAYAGDLKSPDAYASCGFDPHPGHQFLAKSEQEAARDAASGPSYVLDASFLKCLKC